ncbi:MAG: adenylosuccinate synthetase [Clostridia bacterium]|nr:adenylosuccinate synthetase [Clostridia bacterium]
MIRFVLLDLDDTILDFHKAEAAAIRKALTELEVVVNDAVIHRYSEINAAHWPSGVFYDHTTNIIGNGVAFSVDNFVKEMANLKKNGVTPKVLVSDRAQIVMPYHVAFDCYEEERLSSKSFGSTKSGIAPFYSDKFSKIGFQINELFDDEEGLKEKIAGILEVKNATLKNLYHKDPISVDEIFNKLMEYKTAVAPYVGDAFTFVHDALKAGKTILLEGQLGSLKDTDFGIYPMVTSSNTIAGYGAVGAGIPPYEIKDIVTVVKAYSSAVGAGEFVSEIFGEEADLMRNHGGDGGEYGATTGRPRRMGWLDLVATRYGCQVQGTTEVAFTVLDALGYLDEIPVCVAYELDGRQIDYFPPTTQLKRCKPVLKVMKGWKCDISSITNYDDLPQECKDYVEFAEQQIGFPITMVSNGPKRENLIYRK